MTKPQQPELRRSGLGATDDDSARSRTSGAPDVAERGPGPAPPENRPGHHPDREQDKPDLES